LKGRLDVREGRIDIDHLFQDQPSEIQIVSDETKTDGIVTITKGESESSDFFKRLAMEVDISVPRNLWVKGRKKNVELAGTVTLRKASEKSLVLVGSIKTVRGSYEFQSRLFKIRHGDITFIGLEGTNPNLDVEAETKVKDVNIILRITGTAKNPELLLDSRPPMDQADIVSYLVFGRPTGKATTQQAFKAEETALGITGNLAAGKLEEILAETLHLDTLSIDPGTEKITKGSVSLGKYVTPRVFVTYQHPFEQGESPELDITYEINRDLGLSAEVGNERTSGVDLIWEHEF
jgi:translocation and assembly module TamB